jgi:hypothetical protein
MVRGSRFETRYIMREASRTAARPTADAQRLVEGGGCVGIV